MAFLGRNNIAGEIVKTQKELAAKLGLSHRRVVQMVSEGMPITEGAYSVDAALDWRSRNISVPSTHADDSKAELEKAKLRIEVQRGELKLRKEAGELVERAAFESKVLQMFHRVRSRLQAIPGEVGSSIPPESRAETIADLQHKIALVLTEMEHWAPDET